MLVVEFERWTSGLSQSMVLQELCAFGHMAPGGGPKPPYVQEGLFL